MSNRRRIIIFAIIVVVLIGVSATAAVLLSQHNNSSDDASKDTSSNVPKKSQADKTADNADKTAYEGDVKSGIEELDTAIKNTTDKEQQYVYYSRKATLLFNNNDLPGALEAAQQAFNLKQSSDSAAFVGQIGQKQGNKQLAIEYYKKAIELIDSSDPYAKKDKSYYQGIIDSLGGN